MDVQGICPFADYFIVCNGSSDRMLRALGEAVRETGHKEHKASVRLEGRAEHGWVLADLGSVVVHIFSPERRKFYDLEGLWHEAKILVRIQ